MLRFRCGPGASRGHKLNMPHYETLVDVALTKPDELTTLNSRRQRVHAQVGLEPEEHEFGQRPAEKRKKKNTKANLGSKTQIQDAKKEIARFDGKKTTP